MDFTSMITQSIAIDTEWWKANGFMVGMAVFIFLQWIALQALMIHYHFFRESLKRPTPDQIRFSLIERTIGLQTEQHEKIFGKLASLTRDIDSLHEKAANSTGRRGGSRPETSSPSIEATMASLGELNLKKRLQELQGRPQ